MPICARILCVALLFVVAGPSATYASNLVKTGSFEFPVVPIGGFTQFSNGQKAGPWKVVGASGNVAIINANFTFGGFTFPAKSGVQWMDLTGSSNTATGIQQSFATTPGTTYTLSFFIGSGYNPGGPVGTSSTVRVRIDGTAIGSFTFNAKPGSTAQQWRKFSTEFQATRSTTSLVLTNGDPPFDTDNGVDVVAVTPVPAP